MSSIVDVDIPEPAFRHAPAGYPRLTAVTCGFQHGAPHAVTCVADGARVFFLRSSGPTDPVESLWLLDVLTGVEHLVADPRHLVDEQALTALTEEERFLRERMRLRVAGIGRYAVDPAGRVAAFTLAGRLFRVEIPQELPSRSTGRSEGIGTVTELPTVGPAFDPRPDPTGRHLAYLTSGTLRVIDETGQDELLAGEDGIRWAMPDFLAAEEFGRYQGYWWAPDGDRILATRVDDSLVPRHHLGDLTDPTQPPRVVSYTRAGTPTPIVTLHLLHLDGSWVDVRLDRETYPYLLNVAWAPNGGPLVCVMRRNQQHVQILSVDQVTGETQVHAELADRRWVHLMPGTPRFLPDGRVVLGGELHTDAGETRCLFADGSLLTPASLYVREVCGQIDTDDGPALVVTASEAEPSERHVYLIPLDPRGADPIRVTPTSGWHTGLGAGRTLVVGSASLEHPGVVWSVHRDGHTTTLTSLAAEPPYAPRPALVRVTDRGLPTAVLYPSGHVAGRKLPVLVDIYGGPGGQEVIAARSAWLDRQWWADQGFAVVVIDNRGTVGISPGYEKAVYRRLWDTILADQVDGLVALAEKHPDFDTQRVAIRGWSFGGSLALAAVLRRPDIYHAAVAGAPVVSWELYDAAYSERYLGHPADNAEVYAHHDLLADAANLSRPLLLTHGLADDNVLPAHTLRLSAALLAAGRPHLVLPLPYETHLAPLGPLREHLLRFELDFVRRALGVSQAA